MTWLATGYIFFIKIRFGLLTSKDLTVWQQEPAVEGVQGDECPDYFRIGDMHYMAPSVDQGIAHNSKRQYVSPCKDYPLRIELIHIHIQRHTQEAPDDAHQVVTQDNSETVKIQIFVEGSLIECFVRNSHRPGTARR